MNIKKTGSCLLLLISGLAYMAPASAGLIGTVVTQCADSAYSGTVTANASDCDGSTAQPTPSSSVIDGSVEFSLTNSGTRTFDFSDSLLSIYYGGVGSSSPDLYIFDFETDLFSINVLDSILGVTATFVGDKLGVLISNPSANGWAQIELNTASVPEPGSLALLALGVAGIAASRKKLKS